jgi:hypothetical protein
MPFDDPLILPLPAPSSNPPACAADLHACCMQAEGTPKGEGAKLVCKLSFAKIKELQQQAKQQVGACACTLGRE